MKTPLIISIQALKMVKICIFHSVPTLRIKNSISLDNVITLTMYKLQSKYVLTTAKKIANLMNK